jgi:hypothetical protein
MLATWLGASSTRTVVLITEPDVANLCESGFIRGSSWVGISSLTWREIGVRGASKVRGAVPSMLCPSSTEEASGGSQASTGVGSVGSPGH